MENQKLIVLVEDEKDDAELFRTLLEREGYAVEVIDSGENVLPVLRLRKTSLVLLDLMIPVKNGFEILAEIKRDPELKDLKVIVLSNLSRQEDIEKAMALGALEYISKTDFSNEHTADRLRQYF